MLRRYYEYPPPSPSPPPPPPPRHSHQEPPTLCPFHHHHHHHHHHQPHPEEPAYASDEFRMYAFKIKRCSRTRSHDWTQCPFAHRGEKAQRRDPRKFDYCAIACPAFRGGRCLKGDACEFAHGVFEYWLHPARYRTRACNAGRFCQRKVCFFAHTPDQLRSETKYRFQPAYRVRTPVGGEGVIGDGIGAGPLATEYRVSEFLKSLRSLQIREDSDFSGSELPEIEWVSDLVESDHAM